MATKKRAVTCRDAIQEVFADEDEVLSADQVTQRVCARYPDKPWKPATIHAHLAALSVNPPAGNGSSNQARHVWLYSLGDGSYRRWRPVVETSIQAEEPDAQGNVSQGQPEDCQQTVVKKSQPSENEVILARLEKISSQLSSQESFAMISSRRKRENGLFMMGIGVVLAISIAALARDAPVSVFAAVGAFFVGGALSSASGCLSEIAFSEDTQLAEKIDRIGGSTFLFDKRAMMRWAAARSSSRLRASLVCGVMMYAALALTAVFVVLSVVSA